VLISIFSRVNLAFAGYLLLLSDNTAIDITPEDIFIGCYAVAEEKDAIAKMHFLREKGYNASYFFIPDYVLNGKKLYRVFAGPFSNSTNAKTALAEIQKFRAQAYIFRVK
jgi:hypothetical protein